MVHYWFDDVDDDMLVDSYEQLALTKLVKLKQARLRWKRLLSLVLARKSELTLVDNKVGRGLSEWQELSHTTKYDQLRQSHSITVLLSNSKPQSWKDFDESPFEPFASTTSTTFLYNARLHQVDIDLLGTLQTIAHFGLFTNLYDSSYRRVEQQLRLVVKLLEQLKHQLSSMTVHIFAGVLCEGGSIIHELIGAINGLSHLKKLSIELSYIELFGGRYDHASDWSDYSNSTSEPLEFTNQVFDNELQEETNQGIEEEHSDHLHDDGDNIGGYYDRYEGPQIDVTEEEVASEDGTNNPDDGTEKKIELSVLGHLQYFHFHSADNPNILCDSFSCYAEKNDELKEIVIATRPHYYYWVQSPEFQQLSEQLRDKIRLCPIRPDDFA